MRHYFIVSLTAACLILPAHAQAAPRRGSIISVELVKTLSAGELRESLAGLPKPVPVKTGASYYRITYWSRLKGKPAKASGVFAVPTETSHIKGIVSYFRGTEVSRSAAPSLPANFGGLYGGAVFAGNGYYYVAPDYFGFGASKGVQTYVIAKPQADASIDLMRAVRAVAQSKGLQWTPSLYMVGFSQGGQTVAAVHRELERAPLASYQLKASVGIAGPYNLRDIAFKNAVTSGCQNCTAYVAMGTFAYARYYGFALTTALKPPYAKLIPSLFDGSKSPEEIWPQLPASTEELLQPAFLASMRANRDNWFNVRLAGNETYDWAPKAPFKIAFGDDDKDVSPDDAKGFYAAAKARGGNVLFASVAGADHMESSGVVIPEALQWFDQLGGGD